MSLFTGAITIISYGLMGLGSIIMFIGALGLFRFSDVYMRLHASSKVNTGGALSILIGLILHCGVCYLSLKLLIVILLIVILTPFASHAIARSAHLRHMGPIIPFESYPRQRYSYDLSCFPTKETESGVDQNSSRSRQTDFTCVVEDPDLPGGEK